MILVNLLHATSALADTCVAQKRNTPTAPPTAETAAVMGQVQAVLPTYRAVCNLLAAELEQQELQRQQQNLPALSDLLTVLLRVGEAAAEWYRLLHKRSAAAAALAAKGHLLDALQPRAALVVAVLRNWQLLVSVQPTYVEHGEGAALGVANNAVTEALLSALRQTTAFFHADSAVGGDDNMAVAQLFVSELLQHTAIQQLEFLYAALIVHNLYIAANGKSPPGLFPAPDAAAAKSSGQGTNPASKAGRSSSTSRDTAAKQQQQQQQCLEVPAAHSLVYDALGFHGLERHTDAFLRALRKAGRYFPSSYTEAQALCSVSVCMVDDLITRGMHSAHTPQPTPAAPVADLQLQQALLLPLLRLMIEVLLLGPRFDATEAALIVMTRLLQKRRSVQAMLGCEGVVQPLLLHLLPALQHAVADGVKCGKPNLEIRVPNVRLDCFVLVRSLIEGEPYPCWLASL